MKLPCENMKILRAGALGGSEAKFRYWEGKHMAAEHVPGVHLLDTLFLRFTLGGTEQKSFLLQKS